ncbi:hypothetical protein NQ314_021377 [Rhamnusium bicolor]|uniref:Uncharacterized protein n=1 Tax=Rhamnusium bicolor TaxID=1586634 RepID=A0AAV8WJ24_9CUCU|nr:hypothetical protein NQ314_021377 [Rhamnusium bicolor]
MEAQCEEEIQSSSSITATASESDHISKKVSGKTVSKKRGAKMVDLVFTMQSKAKDSCDNNIRRDQSPNSGLNQDESERGEPEQTFIPEPTNKNHHEKYFEKASVDDSFSDFSPDDSEYLPTNSSSDSEEANIRSISSDSEVSNARNQLSGMEQHPEVINKPRRKKGVQTSGREILEKRIDLQEKNTFQQKG